MKILMVVNWYTPITEKVFTAGVFHYEQSIALQKYCDIRLYWPFEENVIDFYENIENGLYTYRSPWNKTKGKLYWFKETMKYMKRICRQFQPDIIHANVAYPAGLISVIVAKKFGIPVVLTEHAPIEQMYLNNPVRKMLRRYVYKNTRKNICVSKDSMSRLSMVYPKVKFGIIYNAVIDPCSLEMDNMNYRKKGYVNCAIVAAFYDKEIKGYQYLLPAIKKVNQQGIRVILHICGGGLYKEYYEKMAFDLGIEEYCVFYGRCDRKKVYSIVKQMDFCVSSSVYECSGVSVQEEMLLGKPILVTKSGGANSLTTEYTAIVVERNSTEALVDGLVKMSGEFGRFDTTKIQNYAYQNFEISNVTNRYIELYRDILENV